MKANPTRIAGHINLNLVPAHGLAGAIQSKRGNLQVFSELRDEGVVIDGAQDTFGNCLYALRYCARVRAKRIRETGLRKQKVVIVSVSHDAKCISDS
jgi:hypothetical protein